MKGIALLMVLLLAGCATAQKVVFEDEHGVGCEHEMENLKIYEPKKFDKSSVRWRSATPADYELVKYNYPYPCNTDVGVGLRFVHEGGAGGVDRFCRHPNGGFEFGEVEVIDEEVMAHILDGVSKAPINKPTLDRVLGILKHISGMRYFKER
jgi:hypothetical protein